MTDADVEPVPCRDCGTPVHPNMGWCEECDKEHRGDEWEFAPFGPF